MSAFFKIEILRKNGRKYAVTVPVARATRTVFAKILSQTLFHKRSGEIPRSVKCDSDYGARDLARLSVVA